MNPRRPHPYQISDSEFEIRHAISQKPMWEVWESWWEIDRNGEKDMRDEWCAAFSSEAEAIAERDRRAGR